MKFETVPKNKILKKIKERMFLRKTAKKLREQGQRVVIFDEIFMLKRFFKMFCGILWKHQWIFNKEKNGEICAICENLNPNP